MAPAMAEVNRVPGMMPVQPGEMLLPASFAKDAVISWFRGEFAAANAIIDALCSHLSELENGRCEYEHVFGAIHRRRLNWIPILQMQKYFSIADVTLELKKVAEDKSTRVVVKDVVVDEVTDVVDDVLVQHVNEEKVEDVLKKDDDDVEDSKRNDLPETEIITDTGSQEAQLIVENNEVCSNQAQLAAENNEICSNQAQVVAESNDICSAQEEDWEARRAEIKMTKGFVAKESVKGHMVNVVRGLKMYEDILNETELSKLTDYVNELRIAGQNGELSGETFIKYNQQSKTIKRELIQFGAPIFGHVKDDASSNFQDSHIEPIPAPLEDVIEHLIQYHLISENRRPNSCIISFFDEGEFSQPFLKPPHLEQPISTLLLSESTMAFGRTLVCDDDGNYKGPLMLSLNQGSLLVMRGNSADMARHVMCQSPTKRISVTFFKVRIENHENISSPTAPMAQPMTVWQPNVPTLKTSDTTCAIPKWGVLRAPQLLMLAPVRPMVMTPRRLPRGGTGVFLPWSGGSRKPAKQLPPRAQRGRLLVAEAHRVEPTSDLGISVA